VHALTLLVLVAAAPAEIRDLLSAADLDRQLATLAPGSIRAVDEHPNYAIFIAAAGAAVAAPETHDAADEVLWIKRGAGGVVLDRARHSIAAGDLVHVPRRTPHRLFADSGRLEYVAVRIFPTGEHLPARTGLLAQRRMPDVVKKADIDAVFARFDTNQPLHSAPGFTMNYVIYRSRSGPWEAHRGCVDIYFLQTGAAEAELGGEIANPKEESPGEIRGTGVSGARRYRITPGDLVVIPRSTSHHVTPEGAMVGYLLLKVWAE